MAELLNWQQMFRRVAREIGAGDVVALGTGLPGRLPGTGPEELGAWFLEESGAVGVQGGDHAGEPGIPPKLLPGGSYVGTVDIGAIVRGGHVDLAVLEVGRADTSGRFVLPWQALGLDAAPGFDADFAGARRVVGVRQGILLPASAGQSPTLAADLTREDGYGETSIEDGCLELLVTDCCVIQVTPQGLELIELAPGWTADEIAGLHNVVLSISPNLREMDCGPLPPLPWPNKVYSTAADAVRDVPNGAVVNLDGFGGPGGMAHYLMTGLRDQGATGLTVISNTAGIARVARFGAPEGVIPIDHTILVENNQIARSINSYPVSPSVSRPSAFEEAYNRGDATLEVVPQGTLAERLRAGGAGVGAFYTPTAAGTLLAEDKEARTIDGRDYVLEHGIVADFCIMRGHKADTLGNVVYRGTSRNFNPIMATSARVTIVEVDEIVAPGELGPEEIVTPGLFVDRIVKRPADFSPYL